jgi:hypothetical protein
MTSKDKKYLKEMTLALIRFSEYQGTMSEEGWSELCDNLMNHEDLPTWNEINSFCEALMEIYENL